MIQILIQMLLAVGITNFGFNIATQGQNTSKEGYSEVKIVDLTNTQSEDSQLMPVFSQSEIDDTLSGSETDQEIDAGETTLLAKKLTPAQARKNDYNNSQFGIAIPKYNIYAPITFPQDLNAPTVTETLKYGIAHYPGSIDPTVDGNSAFFGHSSNYRYIKSNYNSIFASLPRVRSGTEVFIKWNGQTMKYIVRKSFRATKDDTWTILPDSHISATAKRTITLTTCWPIGTAKYRWVVVAEAA